MRCGRRCSPACSRCWPRSRSPGPARRAPAARRAGAARGRRRPVRPAVERRVAVRHAHAVAAGRPGLGGVTGGLRRAAADLPGRRLAHAERGRPGEDRPYQRRLRGLPRGGRGRVRRRGPRPGRAGVLQPAVPQRPGLGPAGAGGPGLRHRRRARRRAGAGRTRKRERARRLLPARTVGHHRGDAVPLPADRGGPGKSRICRTVLGTRLGGRRTRADRGGPAGRLDAAGHRARGERQAAAPAACPGHRPRLPDRPAGRRLHPAAGPGGAHRPDPDRARLAGREPCRPTRSARRSPGPTAAPWRPRSRRWPAGTPPSRYGGPRTTSSSGPTRWPTRWCWPRSGWPSGGPPRTSAGGGPAGGGWPGWSPPRCRWAPSWPTWCRGRRPPTRPGGCTRSRWRWPPSSPGPRWPVRGAATRSGRSARSACSRWSCWGST